MEAAKHDKRTVFVRGIPFSTGPEEFEAHFSELGPVRTSFLVKDKAQAGHKGFGFVQFALPEDAQKAAEQLHNTELNGRKLKVEPAVKRAPLVDRKKRKFGEVDSAGLAADATAAKTAPSIQQGPLGDQTTTAAAQKTTEKGPKTSVKAAKKAKKQKDVNKKAANPKQQLLRTVALGNLQANCKDEAVAMARAAGKVEEVVDPPTDAAISNARLKQDGCSGQVIFVLYDSISAALAAVAKLHGHPLGQPAKKGAKRQKVQQDGGKTAQSTLWARQVSGEGLHLKKWRLIVRNLSFQVKEAELKAALEAGGGFVWELSLPRNAAGGLKGFGFATFTTRGHAENAIKTTNGKVLAGRQVVVDWAMAKARFTDAQAAGATEDAVPKPAMNAVAAADATPVHKELDEAGREEQADAVAEDDPDAEHTMVQGVLESLLKDDADADDLPQPKALTKSDGQQQATAGADKTDQKGSRLEQQAGKAVGSTAQAAGQDSAQQAGSAPVARDSSKTVFVRALPLDVSQDQLRLAFNKFGKLRACRLVMNKATQQPKGTAFVEFWDSSAASAAAAACQKAREGGGGGVMVGGRTVEVDLALSQDDARSLASGKDATGTGKGNCNLYLAKEGTIEEGSAAWESMSQTDKTKRKRAAEEKNLKLRSPNFSVSRTRLSVRNLPFTLQEKELKQLFIAAVKEHASKAKPQVKQAKVLRDPERLNPADGLPRSRGLGFVEFTEHEHAICALRQLNNNPAPFGRDKRPIVEFALESAQAVRKMASKQAWQKSQAQTQGAAAAAAAAAAAEQTDQRDNKPAPTNQYSGAEPNAAMPQKKRKLTRQKPIQQEPDAATKGKAAASVGRDIKASQKQKQAGKQQDQQLVTKSKRPAKLAQQRPGPERHQTERKRKAEAALDLAAQSAQGQQPGRAKKSRSAKSEKGDKLDDMVASYKAKFFGSPNQKGAKTAQKPAAAGISRWFE